MANQINWYNQRSSGVLYQNLCPSTYTNIKGVQKWHMLFKNSFKTYNSSTFGNSDSDVFTSGLQIQSSFIFLRYSYTVYLILFYHQHHVCFEFLDEFKGHVCKQRCSLKRIIFIWYLETIWHFHCIIKTEQSESRKDEVFTVRFYVKDSILLAVKTIHFNRTRTFKSSTTCFFTSAEAEFAHFITMSVTVYNIFMVFQIIGMFLYIKLSTTFKD